MIKIIAGTFGYFNGRKKEMITAASGARSFDPKLEARLVSEGIAEYVDAPKKAVDDSVYTSAEKMVDDHIQFISDRLFKEYDEKHGTHTADIDTAELIEETVDYNSDMKLAELKAIGEQFGLEVRSFKSKAEVIAVLDGYFAAKASDEPPPVFGAETVK